MDVKTTEVEKVNKIGRLVGQAQHQPVSPEIVGGTVEELEREIDRLQKQNENLTNALRWILQDLEVRHLADSMSHSIYTSASRALGYPVGKVGKPMLPDWDKEAADLVQQNENQARTIKGLTEMVGRLEEEQKTTLEMLKDGHSAHVLILKGDVYVTRRQLAHLLGDEYQKLFAALEENTPQNPVICPVEPPVPTLTANVPREAVGVHAAPNVRIAGG